MLYEQSEFALYEIDKDLGRMAGGAAGGVARLGSVTDADRVSRVIAEQGVQIILHAAAYKHVPMVEMNPLEGVRNNVLGTQIVADAAADAGVERFILVSTDKAVRPTNVMGASKRMAELIVQDRQTRNTGTIFTMVRFGNVLGSSGSVIPLFREQIMAGGPITLTHEDVTRYFMTIPEAAQLVLLAGSFADRRRGVRAGHGQAGEDHRSGTLAGGPVGTDRCGMRPTRMGDIEIVTTGLRPGEKLYEELLIGDNDDCHTAPQDHARGGGRLERGRDTERRMANCARRSRARMRTGSKGGAESGGAGLWRAAEDKRSA